mmetsp:Transcript_1622/g.2868  ORF Transcript_1622/g.2868 Transcript_1622/m.2868 type:complete len:205 (-) Transcript_1622:974-1588(-)
MGHVDLREEGVELVEDLGLHEVSHGLRAVGNVLRTEQVVGDDDLVVVAKQGVHTLGLQRIRCLGGQDVLDLLGVLLVDLVQKVVAELAALHLVLLPSVLVEVVEDALLQLVPHLHHDPHRHDGLQSLRYLPVAPLHQLLEVVLQLGLAVNGLQDLEVLGKESLVDGGGSARFKAESRLDLQHCLVHQGLQEALRLYLDHLLERV